MLELSIKTDFKDIDRKLKSLSDDLQKRVIPAALNKVGAKAKTEMRRAITSEFNLSASEVSARLRLVRAGRSLDKWLVILDPFASARKYAKKGTRLNLIRFVEKYVTLAEGRRRKKAGTQNQLHFKIKKNGGRVMLNGAFVATNKKTRGTAVFTRVEGQYIPGRVNRKGNSKHAEKLRAMQTIDVPQMFNTRRIRDKVEARIRREMSVEFDRAINAAIHGRIR